MRKPPPSSSTSPPWQVLQLVAHYLDTKALATATCVCKSWEVSMSSDHLWQPICSSSYPSLFNLHSAVNISYHKLYSLGRVAENRRLRKPPKPCLSINDLIFHIDIKNNGNAFSIVKPGGELKIDKNGVFRFEIDVESRETSNTVSFDALDSLRITWNVVLEGYKGVFNVMDCNGKGSLILGLEGWFSKELPAPGCCAGGGGPSGLVADLRLGLRPESGGGGKVVVQKVSMGVLSVVSWRYIFVDDALRYLHHFLSPILSSPI